MHELVTCLSDTGSHVVGGRVFEFARGRTILLPSGVAHAVVGAEDKPAVIAFVCFSRADLAECGDSALQHSINALTEGRRYASGLTPASAQRAVELSEQLQDELASARPFGQTMARGLLMQLMVHHCRGMGAGGDSGGKDAHATRIGQVCDAVSQGAGEGLSLDAAAAAAGMCRSLFTRRFRQYTGMSFTEFVAATRIKRAMIILAQTEFSVAQVALECGIPNMGYFHRLFRKHCDMTPRQYRLAVQSRGPFVPILKEVKGT